MDRVREGGTYFKTDCAQTNRTPSVIALPIAFTVLFMLANGSGPPPGGDGSELNSVCTSLILTSKSPIPPCVHTKQTNVVIRKSKW
jgi:hypothetical protein